MLSFYSSVRFIATLTSVRLVFCCQPCRCASVRMSFLQDKSPEVNITFAVLPPLPEPEQRRVRKKRQRRELQIDIALKEWDEWLKRNFNSRAVQTVST